MEMLWNSHGESLLKKSGHSVDGSGTVSRCRGTTMENRPNTGAEAECGR